MIFHLEFFQFYYHVNQVFLIVVKFHKNFQEFPKKKKKSKKLLRMR